MESKKFALIGYPLGHSLSEYIHNAGFKSIGIDATYELIETRPDQLVDRIKYLRTNNYVGFNITIPLKLPVTMFLDDIDQSVNLAHAVNTVKIDQENFSLKGYNTDIAGFKNAIPPDVILSSKTIGILGTGGAARAAITALAQCNVKEIKLYTRNVANCLELLEYLRKAFPLVEFNAYQIDRIRDLSSINFLVNTTPIGMSGNNVGYTPVEENELLTLPQDAIVYDVIYNPKKTLLVKLAQKHNYRTITGLDMLIHQAVEAEKIWTGKIPDFKDMKIAALEEL
ncbi:shikimate dehydrogenase [bacterium]|nr:shikimate dehydrogenase [bacterium]